MKKVIFINKNLWSFYNFRYELVKKLVKIIKFIVCNGGSNKHTKKFLILNIKILDYHKNQSFNQGY